MWCDNVDDVLNPSGINIWQSDYIFDSEKRNNKKLNKKSDLPWSCKTAVIISLSDIAYICHDKLIPHDIENYVGSGKWLGQIHSHVICLIPSQSPHQKWPTC